MARIGAAVRTRGRGYVVVLVGVAGVLAGCTGSSADDPAAPTRTSVTVAPYDPAVPVAKVAAGPPGTPLGAGFVVAEGSTLVGPVSPVTLPITRGVAGTGVRWQALLWVSDDLPTVVDRYLAQGEALGLRWVGVGPTCTKREGAYRCRALGVGVDERGRAGELVIQGSRLSGSGGTTQQALVFTWRRPQEGRVVTGHPDPSTPEPGGSAAGPALPASGEALGDRWYGLSTLVVPGGVAVAAPIRFDVTGVYQVLVLVADDGPAAMGALRAAFERSLPPGVAAPTNADPTVTLDDGTEVVRTTTIVHAGGPTYRTVLVDHPTGPDTIVINTTDG